MPGYDEALSMVMSLKHTTDSFGYRVTWEEGGTMGINIVRQTDKAYNILKAVVAVMEEMNTEMQFLTEKNKAWEDFFSWEDLEFIPEGWDDCD